MRKKVKCKDVIIGGDAPVSIQSMTNVDSEDADAVIAQIKELKQAGCQIVRIAVPTMKAAEAFGTIRKSTKMPLVADIHFDYRLALESIYNGADKIRINPGNIGSRHKVMQIAREAERAKIPIRVGVNSGSLEKDILERDGKVTARGLADSALRNLHILEDIGFDNLVVSLKSSDVQMNHAAYKLVAAETEHPIHIGVTEAGGLRRGKVKSAAGIGALLLEGIGDTMRVSLTGDPVEEVLFAREILNAVGARRDNINIISCPTCGRTKVDLATIVAQIEEKMAPVEEKRREKDLPGITVAVMGCAVNGPGEAEGADLGVACGDGKGLIFDHGKIIKTVVEKDIISELLRKIEDYE